MQPFFFGAKGKELFGIHHPPRGAPKKVGIVLCHPAPQLYMHAHFAIRKLATMLARAGHPVLRFDYFGTGDSAGDSIDGTLDQWRADIRTAVDELRDVSGVSKVSLVGMGLGATLAAQLVDGGLSVHDLVLWDPVVDGRGYLGNLCVLRDRLFAMDPSRRTEEERRTELLGFPLTDAMRASIEQLDLLQLAKLQTKRTSLIVSETTPQYQALRLHLERLGGAFEHRVVLEPGAKKHLDESLLASAILDAIVTTLAEEKAA